MKPGVYLLAIALTFFTCVTAMGAGDAAEESARRGLEQILELWRSESYEALYTHLTHQPGKGWDYYADRIVRASKIPACCWEMLQDVQATQIDQDHVNIRAKVGLERKGAGTSFVTRNFSLRRINGIWMLPMQDILDLSDYNMQRIPDQIYERPPNQ